MGLDDGTEEAPQTDGHSVDPPSFDFEREPTCIGILDAGSLTSEVNGNFFRNARWCSDGTSILTTAEDRVLRIYDTPDDRPAGFGAARTFKCPDAIHGALWYPSASLDRPETFCFVTSIRETPVRLIDASDGRVRASYPIVDHRERFIAPHSMAFNPSATKLYCGFENAIEVFDIATPGYDTSDRLKTSYSRKEGGQKGIISALAFAMDYSGTFAAGTFGGTVSIYDEASGATPVQHLSSVTGGGVTQLAFHPLSANVVFVGSRRASHIQVVDLRNPTEPFTQLPRSGSTNQRLFFDVDPWGRYLATGDEFGEMSVWDLSTLPTQERICSKQLHNDAVSSVQLHPLKPLLLSTSGSRSSLVVDDNDEDDESADGSTISGTSTDDAVESSKQMSNKDASMRIWSLGSVQGAET